MRQIRQLPDGDVLRATKFVTVTLLITISVTATLIAQPSAQLRFDTLTTANGLSSSSISAICQDGTGFLWFGTQAGLNRFDGRNVRVYEDEPFQPNSLVQNQIQTMFSDTDGSLWIGTYGGLSHYQPSIDKFTSYSHNPDDGSSLSNNVVVSIARDGAGRLWVGTLDGLNRLDEANGRFTIYRAGDAGAGALPNSVVRALKTDSTGRLWIGTYGGLSRYLPESDSFETWQPKGEHNAALGSTNVMTISEDPDQPGLLWIGTWGGGLCRFDTRNGDSRLFTLPDDRVYVSLIDSWGRLWIGTWGGGLILFSRTEYTISQYTADQRESIPNNIVYSLYQDRGGVLWIGTNGGAVAKLVDWQNRYTYYRHNNDDPASLPGGKITAMVQDAKGRVWYAVYNAGLHRLDPITGRFIHFRHEKDNPRSLSNDMVNDIFVDHAGRMWVSTNAGIDLYHPATGDFSHPFAEMKNSPLKDEVVDRYFEDRTGSIWIGTYTKGLYRFSPDLKSYVHFGTNEPLPRRISNDLIRVIYEDSEGTIWIGTNNGLFRHRAGSLEAFVPGKPAHESISEGSVRDIHEGPGGTLYLATMGGGVNILDTVNGRFNYLTTADGLASNMVLGIIDDGDMFFFMTQRGVSVYNPSTKDFQTLDESSGLLSNELTDGHMIDSKGVLHLGSAAGVTVVPQFSAVPEGPVPPIVITELQVLGKNHPEVSSSAGIYRRITLPYRYNTVSIEFAVLDYANPRQNRYSIKLEGLDKSWHDLTSRNYVTFSGLAPGSYTLRVTGAGSRNNWNRIGLSLPIRVLRPWWATGPAFGVYALLAAAIVLFLILRDSRARRAAIARAEAHAAQTRELEIRVRERTSQIEEARRVAVEATAAKSTFMARMSHEIRTPLNGVYGMLTLLRRTDLDPDQARYVDFARAASDNLYNIVSDVLDFERIMAGRLSVSSRPFSLREALQFVVGIYGPQAADKGIGLLLELNEEIPETVVGDRTRTIQIVTNLVSNALKYTDRGTIRVALSTAEKPAQDRFPLSIAVSDTGMGIPADQLGVIFEQFAQLDTGEARRNLGTGLGLSIVRQLCSLMEGEIQVTSTPGVGSCFTVTLPYGIQEHGRRPEALAQTTQRAAVEFGSAADTMTITSAPDGAADEAEVRPAGTVRILVAEDEGINRLFITSILRAKGYEVISVTNGAEAVRRAAAEEFDLVLMDIGMPVLGGLDAAAQIRAAEASTGRPRTPILALTAYAYKSDIDSCFDAGMDDFISKPIDEALLFDKITEWAGRRN